MLADENFDNDILRGIVRRFPRFDVVRAQDIEELSGKDDVVLLMWAGRNDRVLLTHDVSTIIPALRNQPQSEFRRAPVVLIPDSLAIGTAVEEVLLLEKCGLASDWSSGVIYLPLR